MLKASADMDTVGGRIRYYRRTRGLLQTEVADRAGINVSTLKAHESNQAYLSPETCERIAAALDIDPSLVYDSYLAFVVSDYGAQIRTARENAGLSREEFATALGVTRNTVRRWEQKLERPTRASYAVLSKHL